MPSLGLFPPNEETSRMLLEVPGTRETAIPVVSFDGPAGCLGPEGAGAVLILHMTMVSDDQAQRFYRQVALTSKAAAQAPGFIRLISFFDGVANWALGFWRTAAEAESFAKSPVHAAAMRDMYKEQFEYTHYAGLWEPFASRTRQVYCDACGATALMPIDSCPTCGNEVADVFVIQAGQGVAPVESTLPK